eukprot:4592898-Lingulodinium_polyedra.AAC.1
MGSESCSQRYIFLARLKELYPAVRLTIHDDACHLRRFAANRSSVSELARSLAFPDMAYVLDVLHARGHTDPWCLQHVHPATEVNTRLLAGRSTE